MKTHSDT